MKLTILGGGTAGWITALFMRECLPLAKIDLIQSEEIGTVGVGEATTPHFVNFLNSVNINLIDFLKKTNGTYKQGISFENWNGDNKKYMHGFREAFANDFSVPGIFGHTCYDYYLKTLITNNLPLEDYLYTHKACYQNITSPENILVALHFDASLAAKYFENLSVDRKINIVEGKFKSVETDNNGHITKILLDNGKESSCDFVFDCSGFHKLLNHKFYGEEWISYEKYLPMKKAIAFWLDSEKEIRPYTRSIAMKYGWMWQIPLQNRIGAGYVFDSDYINEEQAKLEVEEFLGKKIEVRRTIPFETGCLKNFWTKNCMAVGLSSSFVEPLESTSLWVTIEQLQKFKFFLDEIGNISPDSVKVFNTIMSNTMDGVRNFIYLHYVTKRNDSLFWSEFQQKHPAPDDFVTVIEKIKSGKIRYFDLNKSTHSIGAVFTLSSYLEVCKGLDMFEQTFNCENYNVRPTPEEYKNFINRLLEQERSKKC